MPKVIEDKKIYQAVIQTITKRGYAGSTTKQIAETAQVSEVTLFRKYGSKLQLVKQAIAALVEETDFFAATRYTGDIRVDLLRVLQAYQASVVLHGPFFAVLFSEVARNPELARSFDQPLHLFNSIGQLFEQYQAAGQLHQEPPLSSVAGLLGPFIFTALLHNVIPEVVLPPLDLQKHVTLFLEGRSITITSNEKT